MSNSEQHIPNETRRDREIGRCSRYAQLAILAALSAFALMARYTEGQTTFLDLVYACTKDNACVMGVLFLLLLPAYNKVYWGGGIGTAPNKAKRGKSSRVCADVFALLFAISIVVGRAFLVRESVGDTYTYGSFYPIACDLSHLMLSVLVFTGVFSLSRMASLFLFDLLDGIYSRCRRKARGEDEGSGETAGSLAANTAESPAQPGRIARFLASPKHVALVLLVCWLPYLVIFFPGCIYSDAAWQIRQFFGADALTGHHPIATTFIFGWLLSIGKALGSDTLGVFLVTMLQTAGMAYACTRIVERVGSMVGELTGAATLKRFAVPLLAAFFALAPMFGSAATSIKKDSLFYVAFALLMVAAIDLLRLVGKEKTVGETESSDRSRTLRRNRLRSGMGAGMGAGIGSVCARIMLWGTLTSMFRNDGFMFFALLTVCMLAVCAIELHAVKRRGAAGTHANAHADRPRSEALQPRKRKPKPAAAYLAAPLACLLVVALAYFGAYRLVVMPALNVQSGSIGEALTLPIQQIARYYILAPEDVDESIHEGVSALLDESGLTENVYNPQISDNIKFVYFNNQSTAQDVVAFLKAWARAGLKHPMVYASAFVDQTSGWWYVEELGKPDKAIGGMGLYQNVPETTGYSGVLDFDMPFLGTTAMTVFLRLLDAFSYIPLVGLLAYPPIYFWMLVLLFMWGISRRNPKIIMLIPLFGYFAICIASPVSGLLRYAIPVIMTLPVAACYLIGSRGHNGDQGA